ncbi:MAG: hypothetical protein KGY80_13790 [Candidatus Thorarchaeota archaeon]|nr:hypothetical protein [Candidatus Thorarchaeota archaeon]
MNRRRNLVCAIFALLMVVGTLGGITAVDASSTTVSSTNDEVSVSLTIIDANYTDADDDGYADDVIAYFDIALEGARRYNLDIYPSLTLPSGTEYTYAYVINTRLELLHCTMYFIDHATESGDYIFSVEIVSYTGGVACGSAEYVFDPPGGSGDADPCGILVVSE